MSNPSTPQTTAFVRQVVPADAAPTTPAGPLPMGVYESAPVALTNRQAGPIPLGSDGGLRLSGTSGGSPSNPTGVSPSAARTSTGQLLAALANQRFTGFTAKETAGAVARATLYHGTANTDPVIGFINFTAGQNMAGDYGGEEMLVPNGVYFELNAGAVTIVGFSKVVS